MNEIFELKVEEMDKIVGQINKFCEEKGYFSNNETLIFAEQNYKDKKRLFAYNYIGYLFGKCVNQHQLKMNQVFESMKPNGMEL